MGISVPQAACATVCCVGVAMTVFVLRTLDGFRTVDSDERLRTQPTEPQSTDEEFCDFEAFVDTRRPEYSPRLKSAIRRWQAIDAAATAEAAQLQGDWMLILVCRLWGENDPESAFAWIKTHCVDPYEASNANSAAEEGLREGFKGKDVLAAVETKFSETWGEHLYIGDELLQGLHRLHRPEEIEEVITRIPETGQLLHRVLFSYATDLLEAEGLEAALGFIDAREDRDFRVGAAYWFTESYVVDDNYQEVLDWYRRQTDPGFDHSKERIATLVASDLLWKGIDFSSLPATVRKDVIGDTLRKAWDAHVAFESGDSVALGTWLSTVGGYQVNRQIAGRAREALEDAPLSSRLDFAVSMCNSNRNGDYDPLGGWKYLDATIGTGLLESREATLAWAQGGHADHLPDRPARLAAEYWIESDPLSKDPGNWAIASLKGDRRDEALSPIVYAMSQADPSATIAWADGIADPDARAVALGKAVGMWWRTDADAAEAWIGEITSDSDRDIALADSVNFATYGHPETDAALAIISRIGDENLRRDALMTMFGRNGFDAREPDVQRHLVSKDVSAGDRDWLVQKYAEAEEEFRRIEAEFSAEN